jgi:NTP pyrophosphatase (non-canonical NTP hydrolase)
MSGTYKGKEESREQYDHLKCIEELNELATVLMQQFNKPHKDLSEDIVEELGDVYYRLENVMDYYDRDLILARKLYKADKCDPVRSRKTNAG